MTDLRELLNKKVAIEAEIEARKGEAISAILELMHASGVTVEDLGAGKGTSRAPGAKRPVKYRDANGNTWTGVGQRPRWLVKALANGASLPDFSV